MIVNKEQKKSLAEGQSAVALTKKHEINESLKKWIHWWIKELKWQEQQ